MLTVIYILLIVLLVLYILNNYLLDKERNRLTVNLLTIVVTLVLLYGLSFAGGLTFK